MNDKLKKMEKREDGFLEVQLKRLADFDDYLFQKMHEDASCLLCIRDYRSKSRLYYDLKGHLTLRSYLQQHAFEKGEFLAFLLFILEDMVRVNASKPICLDVEYIFLSADGKHLKFLVLPLQEDGWLFQKEEVKAFVKQLLSAVHTNEDYETAGLLVQILKQKEFTLPVLLQQLHALQEQTMAKLTWWQRIWHKEKEAYYVRDLPNVQVYPSILPEISIQEERLYCGTQQKMKEEDTSDKASNKVKIKKRKRRQGKKDQNSNSDAIRAAMEDKEKVIEKAEDQSNRRLAKVDIPSFPNEFAHNHQVKEEAYSTIDKREDSYAQTVVLFEETIPYLENVDSHERIILIKEPFTIGRSPDNDLCLQALEVSAYHAAMESSQNLLKDLHSSNGTFVNGEKIHEQRLQDGDKIAFANQCFYYHSKVSS